MTLNELKNEIDNLCYELRDLFPDKDVSEYEVEMA